MRDFFVHDLGFKVGAEHGAYPSFITLDRDGQTVMLRCAFGPAWFVSGWAVYFWVPDIDAMHTELRQRGANLKNPIVDKPYGMRELNVTAPDGRSVIFGQTPE